MALDEYFLNPTAVVLEKMFTVINSTDMTQIPALTRSEKKALRMALSNRLPHYDGDFQDEMHTLKYFDPYDLPLGIIDDPHELDVPTRFMGVTLPLKIPLLSYTGEIGAVIYIFYSSFQFTIWCNYFKRFKFCLLHQIN